MHPEIVVHGLSGEMRGSQQVKPFYTQGLFRAFDPWRIVVEEVVAEGDKVAARITESGTMVGSLMGREPTGKSFTIQAAQICHLREGKVAEMWGFRDSGSQMRQLGLQG